jgi:hypothetical protein
MWIFVTLVLVDLYVWWRLVTDLRGRNKVLQAVSFAVKAALSVILIYLIARLVLYKGPFDDPANAFRFIAFGVINILVISVGSVYLGLSIITRLAGRIMRRIMSGLVITNIILSGILVFVFADGYFRQRFDVKIIREEIPVRIPDSGLDGMKIILISDLHLSSYHGHYGELSRVIDLINAEKPDLLLNTGDFITFGWREFGMCDTILKRAMARIGSFAVSGNHDDGTYMPDYDETYGRECMERVSRKITASGYTLLEDTTVILTHNSARLSLSGVATRGHRLNMSYGDFAKVTDQYDDNMFNIMLIHDPAGWADTEKYGSMPELTLSGHTHGMQIGLPLPGGYISPASVIHKYWKGLYRKEDSFLFVTAGLGTMGMAARIFMPPEIVVLTLRQE